MNKTGAVILILLVCGCSVYQGVGSEHWHSTRLEEIQAAYEAGKLSESDYLRLKNESDAIRQEYLLDGVYQRNSIRRSNRPYRYR